MSTCSLVSKIPLNPVKYSWCVDTSRLSTSSSLRHCLLLDSDHYINAIEAHAQDAASDPLLIVLRGLPGSGKSTLGKAIKAACRDGDVVSEVWLQSVCLVWYGSLRNKDKLGKTEIFTKQLLRDAYFELLKQKNDGVPQARNILSVSVYGLQNVRDFFISVTCRPSCQPMTSSWTPRATTCTSLTSYQRRTSGRGRRWEI